MPITAQYDREADALYVRLGDAARERSIEIDDSTYIDVDHDGRAIGLELLYPSMGINLDDVIGRFQLHQQLPSIISAIAATQAPGVAPTMTGTTHLASSTITTVVVEGTIAAGSTSPAPGVTLAHGRPRVAGASAAARRTVLA